MSRVFQDPCEIAVRQRPTEAASPHPPDGRCEPANGGKPADPREDPVLPRRPPRRSAATERDAEDPGVRRLCRHRLAQGLRGDPCLGHEGKGHLGLQSTNFQAVAQSHWAKISCLQVTKANDLMVVIIAEFLQNTQINHELYKQLRLQ